MNTNREIAIQFFDALRTKGFGAAWAFLAPDAVWWSAGAGELTQSDLKRISAALAQKLAGPLRFEVRSMTAEDTRVSAEATSYGPLKNGGAYNNQYHFLLEFADGKVTKVKEYHDTHHAENVLGLSALVAR